MIWITASTGLFICVVAYWTPPPFFQGLLISVGVTLFGFSLALAIVNGYLHTEEKKRAAIPLMKMIYPAFSELHGSYLIEKGQLEFGIPQFETLLDAYQKNKNPKDLSPEQRNGLYKIIKENSTEINRLTSELHDQLKEMSFILGWSFSPSVMTASLDCRLNIAKLSNLSFDDTIQTKLDACELFLDIDLQATAVFKNLVGILGIQIDEILKN